MKKEELEKLTVEELKRKIKSSTSILFASLVLLILFGVYMFYQMLEGTWKAGVQIAVPLILFAAMIPIMNNLRELKEELHKRKN